MSRKDLLSYPKKMGYMKHPGMIAWLLHRVTAVIIVLYFFFHMVGSSGICGFLSELVKFKTVEAILAISLIFHALNGIRIILMEFGNAVERKYNRTYFYLVIASTVLLSALVIIPLSGVGL